VQRALLKSSAIATSFEAFLGSGETLRPMTLTTCYRCSRHVRVDESACPFCSTARMTSIAPPRFVRASRAAVLAGAVWTTGCGANNPPGASPLRTSESSATPPTRTPTPPTPSQTSQTTSSAPFDSAHPIAQPPAPSRSIVSRVEGVVHIANGRPLADLPVDLMEHGQRVAWTVTDRNGQFRFADVRGGHYTLIVRPFLNTSASVAEQPITIADTAPLRVDIAVVERRTPGNMVAPYGAPALRRRVV